MLFIADAVIQSGFSVVTHNICNELVNSCDLTVFGIRYNGRTRHPCKYYIYPGEYGGDMYGFNFVNKVISKENPDVVVIFNDLSVVIGYINMILSSDMKDTTLIPMFPVNMLPLNKDEVIKLSIGGVNHIIAYTDFSKNEILKINPNLEVTSIYHGVDRSIFKPNLTFRKLLRLEGYFIVGNIGSNTYRKRLDLFLEGFSLFARGKDDVRCLIHASGIDKAYDLKAIARDLGINNKVIFSFDTVLVNNMPNLYNLMDVSCLTSLGEGFALSLVESASCGAALLCSDIGNLRDIWGDNADYINIDRYEYVPNATGEKGAVISVDSLANGLDKLYKDREYLNSRRLAAFNASKDEKFLWETVSKKVFKVLCDVNSDRLSFIS